MRPTRRGRRALGRHRQLRRRRAVRARPRPGARARPAACPSATRRATRCASDRMLADAPRRSRRRRGHRARARRRSAATSARTRRSGWSFPSTAPGWQCKIVLPSILDGDRLNVVQLTVADPDGDAEDARACRPSAYLQLVAATNFKQRVRKMMEYYHADRLQLRGRRHAEPPRVRPGLLREAGRRRGRLQADRPPLQDPGLRARRRTSASRGDPAARPPTTDTFSLPQTQEEFYFALPYDQMDLCLYGARPRASPADEAAGVVGPDRRAGRARVPGHRGEAARAPLPAPRPPLVDPDVGAPDRCAASRAPSRLRDRAPRRRCDDARRDGRRARATAGPTSSGVYRDDARGARARAPVDHRPRHRPAADVERGRHAVDRVQRRDLQLRRAARRARRAAATGSARRATPRSSSTPTRRGASDAFERFNGQWAVALWDAARERAGARARPARRAAAVPRASTAAGCASPARSRRSSPADPLDPARVRPGRPRRDVHVLDDGRRRRRVFAGITSCEPGHVRIVPRDGTTRQRVLAAALPGRRRDGVHAARSTTRSRRCARRSSEATRCACCAPTCRSAATCRAASTARSIAALGRSAQGRRFHTFSMRFEDAEYDETAYQRRWSSALGSDASRAGRQPARHRATRFPTVVAHAERPILRTAPAPLFLLSRLVREHGIKVVLTGEGADEMFAGYDLFREAKVRRFWARAADVGAAAAAARAALPVSRALAGRAAGDGAAVLRPRPRARARAGVRARAALAVDAPRCSACSRRTSATRSRGRTSTARAARVAARRPSRAGRRSPRTSTSRCGRCCRAICSSSQGDRMLMAHSVEGRFPFLDTERRRPWRTRCRRPSSCAASTRSTCSSGSPEASSRRRSSRVPSSRTARRTRSRSSAIGAPDWVGD